MGYALYVRSNLDSSYVRVGGLFLNSREAGMYRDVYFPDAQAWSIQRVRVNIQPVFAQSGTSRTEAA